MRLEEKLNDLDALILVHLDYENNLSEDYIRTIAYASFFLQSCSKPVISIPDNSSNNFDMFPNEIIEIWSIIPDHVYGEPTEIYNFLPQQKNTQDQFLGFGGVYYDGCVASLALRMINNYTGPHLQVPIILENKANPKVREGIVIRELCL